MILPYTQTMRIIRTNTILKFYNIFKFSDYIHQIFSTSTLFYQSPLKTRSRAVNMKTEVEIISTWKLNFLEIPLKLNLKYKMFFIKVIILNSMNLESAAKQCCGHTAIILYGIWIKQSGAMVFIFNLDKVSPKKLIPTMNI